MGTLYQDTANVSPLSSLDEVQSNRGWFIALGIGLIVLGVLAIGVPFVATLATTLFIGWLLIIDGIFHAVHGFKNRKWSGFTWEILRSIIYVIAGIMVVANPIVGTLALTLVLACFFVASGIVKIVLALQHRWMSTWGWLLFDGIVTLILGALIWAKWPAAAVWAIGLLVGVEMLLAGWSMLTIGSFARRPLRTPL